ncbi:biliverdin-producing heme oxygenase [Saccharibacillus sp. CPCC 101409]|uniref:biliverdin-producing heme oxygenase n=1 Tax=Saccharibacillus sp. CPCC 101409 TaxID=3058041 RepID=UPI0026739AFC|nr:biliverdin-producing heme oxygenase [Saccharibacillus sp. CPCC 101409]MDO3412292.1 biliverdin-producing heme oxygenase [Saccharibacillus sp. CPCC 101409]
MTSTILEQLRTETAAYHDRVEANPYAAAIMNGSLSMPKYIRYLELFYGFVEPLEQLADQSGALDASAYDLDVRRKTPMLERDLLDLGLDRQRLNELPRCAELPDLSTPEKLLGSFYVIEGSTMGGQMITRQLSQSLSVTPERGLRYFNAYGAETRPRWAAFRERLLEAGTGEGERREIVASAIETFALLERWLETAARA